MSTKKSLQYTATLRILVLFLTICLSASNPSVAEILPPFYNPKSERWADSILTTLDRKEKIAQLIMVAAWSNKDSIHIREIQRLISEYKIGGLIFFQGGPIRQANLTNDYQRMSKVPLLIGIDGEWGLSMRLDSTVRFPRQMTQSAMRDDSLIYLMGKEIGRQCKRIGIHVNFAPDIDVNNNFRNPVIGSRSYGDDPIQVYKKALYYMNGMQDMGVLANGKHFPGHGNADSDSHFMLPTINQDRASLDSVELYPFQKLFEHGLGSVMVAHLAIPSLDSTHNLPSTLSPQIVTGLLKNEMGFKGLIFTDALNMKAVATCYQPGILDKLALIAGNDILLYTEDVRKAIMEIHLAIENCEITEAEVDERVKKVLMAKHWSGLGESILVDTTNLIADLNTPEGLFVQRKMYEQSVTILSNKASILPIRGLDSLRIASIVIGDIKNNGFQEKLLQYAQVDVFAEEKDAPVSMFEAMAGFMSNYDLIILSLHGTTMKAETNFGIPEAARQFIDTILTSYKTVFVDFGNAYTLSRFNNLIDAHAVVIGYEDFSLTHELVAQAIMGGLTADGTLPVNSTANYRRGSGVQTTESIRLKYSLPEDAGMSSTKLLKIDSLVNVAIKAEAIPGCQVMVVKDQKVVYNKAFGNHTYEDTIPVSTTDLYDVASVTKVASTALAMMKLYEQKNIDLNRNLSSYYPKLKSTNKKNLKIRDIMTHQAGLQSWIPFWKQTMSGTELNPQIYTSISSSEFPTIVADSIFIRHDYTDSIMQWIYKSPLGNTGSYVYSDLGPILMKGLVEKVSDERFEDYLNKYFYTPLQLSNSGFIPSNKFARSRIVPTEFDKEFRKQLVHGYVHDPAAAMMGGVSGNAGLFSNANDLAIIMQMLLNGGHYGGRRFLKESTVKEFTGRQFPETANRRGLLFDKPETDGAKDSPACKSASPSAFGHQGFTGTCVWADPENNLIFIFLSNRVNPDSKNTKLSKMNVRTDIQQAAYDAILVK
ncbi:MAG: serine hydrolase [Bacteroidia bacterium]|nr:serine hydrolase [Bacteroidia bacterium]